MKLHLKKILVSLITLTSLVKSRYLKLSYSTKVFKKLYLISRQFILFIFLFSFFIDSTFSQPERDLSWYDMKAVAKALNLAPGNWMADIGTRDGYYLNDLLTIIGEEGHFFAVDIESAGFDSLHKYMNNWGVSNISTIYSKETNPLLPKASLDAILVRNSYHEFSEPDQMLLYISKALKKTGRLVISEVMHENYQDSDRKTQEKNHVIDIQIVINDLREYGFKIVESDNNFASHPNSKSGRYYWLLIANPSDGE